MPPDPADTKGEPAFPEGSAPPLCAAPPLPSYDPPVASPPAGTSGGSFCPWAERPQPIALITAVLNAMPSASEDVPLRPLAATLGMVSGHGQSLDVSRDTAPYQPMPRSPNLINRAAPKHDPEPFDVEVTVGDDSTASIKGDGLQALFARLGEWGPGAANASFDLELGTSTLRHCKVMQYAAGHVLLVRYNTKDELADS